MQSIILITDSDKLLVGLKNQWENKVISIFENEKQLNLETTDGRIYLDFSDEILNDYEDDAEIELLNNYISGSKHFYSLCYSDEIIRDKFLEESIFECLVYVDDDNGNILALKDYLNRF